MISFTSLKLALYQWASTVSGIPTVWAYQNAPQPSQPFLTLYLTNFIPIGTDELVRNESNGTTHYVGQREFILNTNVIGSNPFNYLEKLRNSLATETYLSSLRVNGIAFVRNLNIVDIVTLDETEWKERASMDIHFRVADLFTDTTDFIEHVELTEEYYDVEQLVYTTTNIIPPL